MNKADFSELKDIKKELKRLTDSPYKNVTAALLLISRVLLYQIKQKND